MKFKWLGHYIGYFLCFFFQLYGLFDIYFAGMFSCNVFISSYQVVNVEHIARYTGTSTMGTPEGDIVLIMIDDDDE